MSEKILHTDAYTIRLRWDDPKPGDHRPAYWINFELFSLLGPDEPRIYNKRGSTYSPNPVESIDEAEIEVDGFVKWDGCTEYGFPGGRPHFCSWRGIQAQHTAIELARDEGLRLCESIDEYR